MASCQSCLLNFELVDWFQSSLTNGKMSQRLNFCNFYVGRQQGARGRLSLKEDTEVTGNPCKKFIWSHNYLRRRLSWHCSTEGITIYILPLQCLQTQDNYPVLHRLLSWYCLCLQEVFRKTTRRDKKMAAEGNALKVLSDMPHARSMHKICW